MKPLLLFGAAALVVALSVALSLGAPEGNAESMPGSRAPAPRALPSRGLVAAVSTGALVRSPETTRLEQRRVLYETVDSLLDASEFERARRLLDDEQERHGDDVAPEWRDLAQGYRLMADCLEKPDAKHRARGEAFLLVNEAQAITAKLRAACARK